MRYQSSWKVGTASDPDLGTPRWGTPDTTTPTLDIVGILDAWGRISTPFSATIPTLKDRTPVSIVASSPCSRICRA